MGVSGLLSPAARSRREHEIEPLLDQALALIVEVTGARARRTSSCTTTTPSQPRFWQGHHCSDAMSRRSGRRSRAASSRARSARAGPSRRRRRTVDERFADLGSVRQQRDPGRAVRAGRREPPIGVDLPAGPHATGIVQPIDRERAELFARQLAPLADRLRAPRRSGRRLDHTREVRERLRCAEIVGRSRALAQLLQAASPRGAAGRGRADHGPVGDRQVDARARDREQQSARVRAVRRAQLRRDSRGADRERAVRRRARRALDGDAQGRAARSRRPRAARCSSTRSASCRRGAQAKLLQLLADARVPPARLDRRRCAPTSASSARPTRTSSERVAAKQFREDLYYRLHVVPLEVPGPRRAPRGHPRARRALLRRGVLQAAQLRAADGVAPRASPRAARRRGRATRASSRTRSRPR